MSPIQSTLWPREPHTEAKHRILQRYLQAWIPILGKYHSKLVYVDACAGPGVYESGEEGSPIIAAKVFAEYLKTKTARRLSFCAIFIEKDPHRFDRLRHEIEQIGPVPGLQVRPELGAFEDCLELVIRQETAGSERAAPLFAFIDPFGHHIPLHLITQIMKQERREVLVSCMVQSMKRFHGQRPDEMTRTFGDTDWETVIDKEDSGAGLVGLYREKLGTLGGVQYTRSFRMRDRNRVPIYHLVFGTNNLKGLEKMNEAMWRVDPVSGGDFGDSTNPNQLTLFSEPDYGYLRARILAAHKGRTVPCSSARETTYLAGYCTKHLTHILDEMQKEGLLNVSGRRGYQGYPEGCTLQFL